MKSMTMRHTERDSSGRWRTLLYDRARLAWRSLGWPVLALLGGGAVVLGVVGFQQQDASATWWDSLYLTLQLFVVEYGGGGSVTWPLQVARFLAPAVAGFAAVKAIFVIFGEQLLRIRLRGGHVVVCGLGDKGAAFARSLRNAGRQVVVIERSDASEAVDDVREAGATVLVGDARQEALLRKAGIDRARHLVAVSGDDGTNAEIVVAAMRIPRARRAPALHCHAHIVDPSLSELLTSHELSGSHPSSDARLDFFNLAEAGARAMLDAHPPFTADDPTPKTRVVVVGCSPFGRNVIVELARLWHLGRHPPRGLTVAIIDAEASAVVADLRRRSPEIDAVCRLAPVDINVARSELTLDLGPDGHPSSVYVCVENDAAALSAALEIEPHAWRWGIPVVVRMTRRQGLASLLEPPGAGDRRRNLHVFPLDAVCTAELVFGGPYELIARAFHAEYVEHTRRGRSPALDDPALVPWEALPEDYREANRDQAHHIGAKLEAVRCRLVPLESWQPEPFLFSRDETELLAQMEHERWSRDRRRHGWRRGPVRDPERKRTPYLVPWADLDDSIREYDRMFVRGLPRFLARAGFQIVRAEILDAVEATSGASLESAASAEVSPRP